MRIHKGAGILAVGAGLALLFGAATPAVASSSKSLSSSNLQKLAKELGSGKKMTFEATYKSVTNGQTTIVSIAQEPPKTDFATGSGRIIDTGKSTYYCSTSGSAEQCLTVTAGDNPIAGLQSLFSPELALTAFNEAKEGLIDKSLGIKTSTSSKKFGGQSATCITVKVHGNGGEYCVTKQGLLAYSGTTTGTGSYFELTSFSKNPSATLFALPAGATTVTLPGGGSIP
jgi:hypothetical protein